MGAQGPDIAPSGSISRTLLVLRSLGRERAQTLTEISQATGLGKPTTLRFLRTLEEEGFAKRNGAGDWSLTTVLWQLGCASIDYDHTGRHALEVLHDVVAATGETAVYALYEAGFTIYVEQVAGPHAVRTHIALGSRVQATATATGRCMLAFQPQEEIDRVVERDASDAAQAEVLREALAAIRDDGYAFNRDGLWRNVWGLGAPVWDRHRRAIGAVGVSAPADRQPADLGPVVEAVQAAANRLTVTHGGTTSRPA